MAGNMLQERQRPQTQPQHNQWTWERFCREEAREAASAFLERVRRFKGRHATARDVHDSTFTNEFSAAFLEESSILMANEGETILPTTNGGATFTASLPSDFHNRVGNSHVSSRDTKRRRTKNSSSSKSSWWNGLFKWSKSKRSRERRSSGSSTSTTGSGRIQPVGSTKQKKRGIRVVKETPLVQLLNLSESEDGMEWNACKLMLVEQQENYQIEIYCPPRNPMPKMSIFCFLIDEVRSTTPLEMPDSNTCFAIKSQNHGEYVFDVKAEDLKEDWVRLLQAYTHKPVSTDNGQLPRSSCPSTSPNRPGDGQTASGLPVVALESSPLLISRTHNSTTPTQVNQVGGASATPPATANRHMSLSDPRRTSVMNASMGPGGSEESVLVDMNSFMRTYSLTRSPNRQRKTMSLFMDPSTRIAVPTSSTHITGPSHTTPNPYVPSHQVNTTPSSTQHQEGGVSESESGVRFPYASPRDSPPPLPRRTSRPYSMFVSNANVVSGVSATPTSGTIVVTPHSSALSGFRPVPTTPNEATPITAVADMPPPSTPHPTTPIGLARPLPATPTEPMPHPTTPTGLSRPLPATPTEPTSHPTTPTGLARPLPATPTENAHFPAIPAKSRPAGTNSRLEKPFPKRKTSQPTLELPVSPRSPHVLNGIGSTHELPSPGNLETCSQSSSSSALHPVSLAALNKQRKSSVPFTPTDEDGAVRPLHAHSGNGGGGNGVWKNGVKSKEKVRKLSAPSLTQEEACGITDRASALTPTSPAYVIFNGKERDFSLAPSNEKVGSCVFIPEGSVEPEEENLAAQNGVVEAAEESESSVEVGGGEEGSEGSTMDGTPSGDSGVNQSVAAENCMSVTSPVTSRGFCEGEERTNHATLYFSQRSGPPQLQVSPGTRTNTASEESENQPPSSGGEEEVGVGSEAVGELQPPPLPARNHSPLVYPPHTPPLTVREEVTSRNSISVSTHSISSLDDRDLSIRTESVTSNPIFVETTEGQGYNQVPVHTRHPYEYWATNQQDITNLRLLCQYPWFHGMISRNNASHLVVSEEDGANGRYLVRQSESREGDFVLTFNYHNRAKHLRMTVDSNGCNIQHLWFDSVPSMLEYFKANSIPLESFWLNDDVKLTTYIDRQASDAFRTTTVLNVEQLNRVPPRRSRSLHLGMSQSVAGGSSHPGTPSPGSIEHRGSSSASTNSLPHTQSPGTGWRQIFRSQRSSSAGNVGRIQRSHSHNAGSVQATGRGGVVGGGLGQRNNRENAYVWRNY